MSRPYSRASPLVEPALSSSGPTPGATNLPEPGPPIKQALQGFSSSRLSPLAGPPIQPTLIEQALLSGPLLERVLSSRLKQALSSPRAGSPEVERDAPSSASCLTYPAAYTIYIYIIVLFEPLHAPKVQVSNPFPDAERLRGLPSSRLQQGLSSSKPFSRTGPLRVLYQSLPLNGPSPCRAGPPSLL